MTTTETNPLRLIDEALPRFDVREIHEIPVHAALDVVYAAIKSVTARDVRLLTPLEVLRVLPGLLVRRRPFRPTSSAPLSKSSPSASYRSASARARKSSPKPSAATGFCGATSQ